MTTPMRYTAPASFKPANVILRYGALLLSIGMALGGWTRAAGQKSSEAPYLDPSLPVERRVNDLIARMTLEEKVSQLQDNSVAVQRLKIPSYTWGNEGLHGDAFGGYATLFPQTIGMAATFDAALVHDMADVISTEARAKYNEAVRVNRSERFHGITFWAPNINIFRDPRWGRGQETYGEDPYLASRLAVAYVTGLQGDNPRYLKALAGPKHMAVHSGPEGERHRFDSVVSAHDLQDTYLPAFHAALTEGHAGSVMCSYNKINGVPSCANHWMLTDTLRKQWNFTGFIISDCGAVGDISTGQHYAADDEHSSAAAIGAGMDSACDWVPDGHRPEYSYLLEAVKDHLATEAQVDQALRHVLTLRFRLGMFDPPELVPFTTIPLSAIGTPESDAMALQAALESIVLLKNEAHFLPLGNVTKIAVVGPSADLTQTVEGNYNAVPLNPITPIMGIQKRFAGKAGIAYAQGAALISGNPISIEYTTLHPRAGSSEFGLEGAYFDNPEFMGKPVVMRTDRTIDFDWNEANPAPGLPRENYSVRWTGSFTPIAPGDYSIGAKVAGCGDCNARERLKLYLDGKLIVEQGAHQTVAVHFSDTKSHSVRLEYAHRYVETHHMVPGGVELLWEPPAGALLGEAVQAARSSDVTVAFVGLSPQLEGEELAIKLPGFEAGDRTDLSLPASQTTLLESLAATGKPLVVVLMSGSALSVPFAQQHVKAILEAWYPGQEGGTALAKILAGDRSPSGRLPVTFYSSVEQLPDFHDYSMSKRTYRYFSGTPSYGFGFGLSYTKFIYSDLKLSSDVLVQASAISASVLVSNAGNVDSDEVVELYLTPPPSPTTPLRKLVGFTRIHLKAGEKRTVTLPLSADAAMTVMDDGSSKLLPGQYLLVVAGAQPQEASSSAQTRFEVH